MAVDAAPPRSHDRDAEGGPIILLGPDHVVTNDRVIARLAEATAAIDSMELFVLSGKLVQIVRDGTAYRVDVVDQYRLAELISHHCDLRQPANTAPRKRGKPKRVSPPICMSREILARGYWSGVRPLVGVIEAPTLRPDGSLLDRPGYDAATGLMLFADPRLHVVVPDEPTRGDAIAAAQCLLDLIGEFPMDGTARSAWLAALLTVVARSAIDGCVPLVLIDANLPGIGKTLAAQVIGVLAFGRDLAALTWPGKADEQRKLMFSIALSGMRVALLDNQDANTPLSGAALDAALTTGISVDRALGTNTMPSAKFDTVLIATGNNIAIGGDLARRVLPCRLHSDDENPEQRDGFRIRNLKAYVREHRGALLGHALTILRAYFVAGRPTQQIPIFSSFEAWSDLVRGAIVWLGLPDPGAGRESMRDRSDRDDSILGALHEVWAAHCRLHGVPEMRLSQVIAEVRVEPSRYPELRHVLEHLDDQLRARALGDQFKRFADRPHLGRKLVTSGKTAGVARWGVVEVAPGSSPQRDGEHAREVTP